jgi:hypothetical protein
MPKPVHEARIDPQTTLKLIAELQCRFKFQNGDFKLLHHWGIRGELNGFIDYCNENTNRRFRLDGNNHRLHLRLRYVLDGCQSGGLSRGKSIADLAKEACKEYPPF